MELIDKRNIVEIGGGSGHMARILAKTAAKVTVFEPCRQLTRKMLPEPGIELHSTTFPGPALDSKQNLVICRQVIEHVADPKSMIREFRNVLTDDGHLYIEAPDLDYIVRSGAYLDIHIQHVHYYSRDILRAIIESLGFELIRDINIKDGHDVGMLFKVAEVPNELRLPPSEWGDNDRTFRERIHEQIERTRSTLSSLNCPIGIYGATLHGQSFLNIIPEDVKLVAAFDDNELVQRHSLYNRFQRIDVFPPEQSHIALCGAIIITAYLHDEEIAARLRAKGFEGEIYSTRPMSIESNSWNLRGMPINAKSPESVIC